MTPPPRQDSTSLGYQWASRAITLAMEFALPALAGAGVDRLWRFKPLGVLIGAGVGFLAGMFHLLSLARNAPPPKGGGPKSTPSK